MSADTALAHARSKTFATWLALLLGSLGAHRFYLKGWRDVSGWLHPLPTLLGLAGALRMHNLGVDDHAAWLLVPLLGLTLSAGMLAAIVIGLTPDDKWAQRYQQPLRPTGWGAVLGVIAALMVGGAVLMGTLAFAGEKFFEYQQQSAH